jgi:hypothetical protein
VSVVAEVHGNMPRVRVPNRNRERARGRPNGPGRAVA